MLRIHTERRTVGTAALCALLLAVARASGQSPASAPATQAHILSEVSIYAAMPDCPGNIATTPDGRVIVSMHPFTPTDLRVIEITPSGKRMAFPNAAWNRGDGSADTLDAVLGVRCDSRGTLWMLDTGLRGKVAPKLVAWDTRGDRLARIIYLPAPVTQPNSFVNDLQVDETSGHVYIADPAGGPNAALIVVDLSTGLARRVLQGHASVTPADIDLVVDGRALEATQADGKSVRPRVGVNPLALDAQDEWLYFGPLSGGRLFRIRTALLRDAGADSAALAGAIEDYAARPPCDGITIDRDNNIYVSSVTENAIGVIDAQRNYRPLIRGPQISWPNAFSFGADQRVFVVINQLHRTPRLNSGSSAIQGPYLIGTFEALAPGVPGR